VTFLTETVINLSIDSIVQKHLITLYFFESVNNAKFSSDFNAWSIAGIKHKIPGSSEISWPNKVKTRPFNNINSGIASRRMLGNFRVTCKTKACIDKLDLSVILYQEPGMRIPNLFSQLGNER